MAKYGNNPKAYQCQSRRSSKPDPCQADWVMRKKTSGLNRFPPNSPDSVIAQRLIYLFFLQSVNMSYDCFDLIVGELTGVRGHLTLSALGNFHEVVIR